MNAMQNEPGLNDYWKVIARRKKFIISLFIISVVITAVVSILMPKTYRAEFIVKVGEGYTASNSSQDRITTDRITTDSIIEIIGKPDNGKTEEIFKEKAHSIKALKVAKLKGFADKLKITIESGNISDMEAAVVKFVDHINNHPLIKQSTDEERKAIAQRLKDITGLIREYNSFAQMYDERLKKRELSVINFVPAEIRQKAIGLDKERRSLENAMKNIVGVALVDKPHISKIPVSPDIKKNIILAGIISLFAGVFLAFLLEYRDMKIKQ
jgi:capsular polysaccharide biosynthesis protein